MFKAWRVEGDIAGINGVFDDTFSAYGMEHSATAV